MTSLRLNAFLGLLFLCFCSGVALAQRPGPQFWRRATCQPYEPRTKLEDFETRYGTMVFKGFTRIQPLDFHGVLIDAVELREVGDNARASGLTITLLPGSDQQQRDNRAFVDYEEIDTLVNVIDTLSRANETMTKMVGFEGRYRTKGDLELRVFRQTRSGTAVTLTTGICEQALVTLSLDDLARVKAMILEAKARLDESK